MKKYSIKIKTVDDYISCQPDEFKEMLEQIRSLIHVLAPAAEEKISYQVPCYKYHGMLVGFGTHKKGCSFYVMSTTLLNNYTKELKGLDCTPSTIHFDVKKTLPVALIKKIVKQRMKQNEAKAKAKAASH